jgi:hypothetical protein
MHCAINLIRAPALKSGYDRPMFSLHKGDCEHCSRNYRYMLLHAGFGDFSYAYCDGCGTLAALAYTNRELATLPATMIRNEEIPASWEPFLRPCSCGGTFRKGAAPRCVYCNSILSAEYAGSHIEKNSAGAVRGWRWQQNWSDTYCLVIEEPNNPGHLRQIADAIIRVANPKDTSGKRIWSNIFSLSR